MACLIVTGMHRSGTSLISKLLVESGWDFGKQQIGPTKTNPYGHFEDIDFVKLHEDIFKYNNVNYLQVANQITVPESLRSKALKLIQDRNSQKKWGWKDPRTSLFLDFWLNLHPSAKVLIIYRHPIEIVNSLVKRESRNMNYLNRIFFKRRKFANIAAEACRAYYESYLSFYERNPSSCIYISVEEILLDPKGTLNELNLRLDSDLKIEGFNAIYDEGLFKSSNKSSLLSTQVKDRLIDLYEKAKLNSICN